MAYTKNMQTHRGILIIIGIIIAVAAFYLVSRTQHSADVQSTDVAGYVVAHISELSPVAASLGGTFYVTSIRSSAGDGVVEYEDGHNAYTADFTYSSSKRNGIRIDSFAVRE